MIIKRGDIFIANLEPTFGSEQGKIRPVIVIQNNEGNKYSPTIIIAPITSKIFQLKYPTNVFLNKKNSGLDKDSNILLNQIRTIDKKRLLKKIKNINENLILEKINKAIIISLGIRI